MRRDRSGRRGFRLASKSRDRKAAAAPFPMPELLSHRARAWRYAAFFGLVFGCLALPCCVVLPADWGGLAPAGGGVAAGGPPKRKSKNGPAAEAVEIAMQIAAAAIARSTRPGILSSAREHQVSLHRWILKIGLPGARQCSLRRIDHGVELRRAFEPGEACWLNPDGFSRLRPRFGFSRDPLAGKGGDHIMMADFAGAVASIDSKWRLNRRSAQRPELPRAIRATPRLPRSRQPQPVPPGNEKAPANGGLARLARRTRPARKTATLTPR